MQRVMDWLLISGVRLLPKNSISRMMGALVSITWPKPLNIFIVKLFAKLAGVNLDEARDPIDSFPSLQDFFVRELKPGVRTFDPKDTAMGSPCDGAWGAGGVVVNGAMLQIKGRPYTVKSLLGGPLGDIDLEGADYRTIYLSPKDYHRFHAPADLKLLRSWYLPGYLWPVNGAAVRNVNELFAVNERIVMEVTGPHFAGKKMWIVAVGATMVGKVILGFSDLTTNLKRAEVRTESFAPTPIPLKKGDYLGHFCFGSTLVLVAEKGLARWELGDAGKSLKLGETLATLL